MALDTTIGGTASDSYATLAEANSYHGSRGFNPEWAAATDADKERMLKWAARLMDAQFRYRGVRAVAEQARAWPRRSCKDNDGYVLPETSVPLAIKEAQAEFAFQLLKEDWTQGLGSITDSGIQVAGIKTTAEQHNPIPDSVARMVQTLTEGGLFGTRSLQVGLG